MRVFKKDSLGGEETYIFENKEIERVKACSGFTQIGTSETTNCYDEGCYSLNNSASDFREDLIAAFAEETGRNEKEFFQLFCDTQDDECREDHDYDDICDTFLQISSLDENDISLFVDSYIERNERHEESEVVFTGRGNDIIFLSDNADWEEITNDDEGVEIIADFDKKEHDGDHGTGDIYSSEKYLFYSSRISGDTAGYSVEYKD